MLCECSLKSNQNYWNKKKIVSIIEKNGCQQQPYSIVEILNQYDMKGSKAKKKILFVSCNGLTKKRVGRSVDFFLLHDFFGHICVFYACFTLIWSWEDGKKLKGKVFFK